MSSDPLMDFARRGMAAQQAVDEIIEGGKSRMSMAVLLIGMPPGGVVTNSPRLKLVEGNGAAPTDEQIQREINEFRGWRVAAVAVTIHEDED